MTEDNKTPAETPIRRSMVHWNGNQVAVVDVETTGLDCKYHDTVQVAVVMLDSDFNPQKDVLPFYVTIRPEHPERADPKAMKVNGLKLQDLMSNGLPALKAADLFLEWHRKLPLPYNTSGYNKCKILPLGQNYGFDKGFLQAWLGLADYDECFHYHNRDTMNVAHFINDCYAMKGEDVPFVKQNLAWLCKKLNVTNTRAHDALQDCLATAAVYKRMCTTTAIFL